MAAAPDSRRRPAVLIADDHIVWRCGLRDVLEPTLEVVAEAGEGGEAVEKAQAWQPDPVVMDILMPGMDGIATARRIKEAFPRPRSDENERRRRVCREPSSWMDGQ